MLDNSEHEHPHRKVSSLDLFQPKEDIENPDNMGNVRGTVQVKFTMCGVKTCE